MDRAKAKHRPKRRNSQDIRDRLQWHIRKDNSRYHWLTVPLLWSSTPQWWQSCWSSLSPPLLLPHPSFSLSRTSSKLLCHFLSAYLEHDDDSMCINMKLGCKFCVDQVALEQHHFDIHDLTTAMEWSTPKLTDTTFPPSATWHWIVWVRLSKDGWQAGW